MIEEQKQNSRSVQIIDTTLRDGMQTSGVYLDVQTRVDIARKLVDLGCSELEAGIPAAGNSEREFIRALQRENFSIPVRQWCRCRESDIIAAAETGCTHIHLSIPLSDEILLTLGWSRQKALTEMGRLIQTYRAQFTSITAGFQDVIRADDASLDEIAAWSKDLCMDRIRLADTLGTGYPSKIAQIILGVKETSGTAVEFHGHNDLGMAVANSLAAAEGGADAISVTLVGIGERCGNASLHQCAMALHAHPELGSAIRLDQICRVSQYFAEKVDRPISPSEPVIGSAAFTHTSSIHISSLRRDPSSYQPYDPAILERQDECIGCGMYSGKHINDSSRNPLHSDKERGDEYGNIAG